MFATSHEVVVSPHTGRATWEPIGRTDVGEQDAWLHAAMAHCRRIGNELLAARARAGSAADELRKFHRDE